MHIVIRDSHTIQIARRCRIQGKLTSDPFWVWVWVWVWGVGERYGIGCACRGGREVLAENSSIRNFAVKKRDFGVRACVQLRQARQGRAPCLVM